MPTSSGLATGSGAAAKAVLKTKETKTSHIAAVRALSGCMMISSS
jgi:hypothetical protein